MSSVLRYICPACHGTNRLSIASDIKEASCAECQALLLDGRVLNVDDKQFFKHIDQDGLLVVADFWAAWCAPCLAVAPVYKKLAEEFSQQIQFIKVDTDEYQKLAGQFHIRGLPTFIIFRNNNEISRQSGAMDLTHFRDWLQKSI